MQTRRAEHQRFRTERGAEIDDVPQPSLECLSRGLVLEEREAAPAEQ
jgi:hypothetical protein